jgi:hypothetical protein
LRLLASGHFFSEKSTAKKKIKSEKTEEKNRCAPLSVSCLFRSVCFASLPSASEGGLRAALLFAERKREKEKRASKRESKEKRERESD